MINFIFNSTALLLVMIGGAFGSGLRYLLSELINQLVKTNFAQLSRFPWATFGINLFGSMLAGILYFFLIKNFGDSNQNMRLLILVGFLGGFTTFSAFSLDFFRLFIAGQYLQAAVYVAASVSLSILALFFGFYFTKFITS